MLRAGEAGLRRSLEPRLARLKDETRRLEAAIEALLSRDEEGRRQAELLASVPGVGRTNAASLVAPLPEPGRLGGEAVASLAGVAPFARDSGLTRGRWTVRVGREAVCRALYVAALVVARHNPAIRASYERLRAAGKPAELALAAATREPLAIPDAMLRRGTPRGADRRAA